MMLLEYLRRPVSSEAEERPSVEDLEKRIKTLVKQKKDAEHTAGREKRKAEESKKELRRVKKEAGFQVYCLQWQLWYYGQDRES